MTFDLFGLDFHWKAKIFGIWLFGINNDKKSEPKHLFIIHYENGIWRIDLFYIRIFTSL